jgi:hypothetical protein
MAVAFSDDLGYSLFLSRCGIRDLQSGHCVGEVRMEETPESSLKMRIKSPSNGLSWVILALALVCLMPSNESLWIDEGFTIPYAQEQGLRGFFHRLTHDRLSEPLMPLGMFSSWAGARVFGQTELGLRLVSALWAGVAIIVFWRIGVKIGLPWLPALMACHPFLWYYAGEARPYAMVIAMSAGVLYGFVHLLNSDRTPALGLPLLLLFGTLLCATHALSVASFAAVFSVTGVVLLRRRWKPATSDLVAVISSAVLLGALGAYYVSSLSRGVQTTWDGPWMVGARGIAFSTYEILGLSGMGPGRHELRQLALAGGLGGAAEGLIRPSTAGVILLCLLYVLALANLLRPMLRGNADLIRIGRLVALVALGSAIFAHGVSFVVGYPFWGRHIAAILPWVVFVTAVATTLRQHPVRRSPGWLCLAIGALLLASGLQIRFHPRHARDDYRSAAHLARALAQEGSSVWWSAAGNCARYYGVPFCTDGDPPGEPCVTSITNMTTDELDGLSQPRYIIASKPDIHDMTGALREYLGNHDVTQRESFTAFKVFELALDDVSATVQAGSQPR